MPSSRKKPAGAAEISASLLWLSRHIDRFTRLTGVVLFWLPLAMMALTFGLVIARYVFQFSSPAVQESVLYLHSAIIALAAAFTLQRDGHVRIDFLYRRLNSHQKAWIDLIGVLVFLVPFVLVMLNYCLGYVQQSWMQGEVSADASGLPYVWLQKSLLLIMPLLLLIQGLSMALHRAAILLGPAEDTDD